MPNVPDREIDTVRRRLLKALGLAGLLGGAGVAARLFDRSSAAEVAADTTTTAPTPTSSPQTTSAEPVTTTTTVAPIVLTVLSKAAWGGLQPGELRPHLPVRLTVHHSASLGGDVSTAPERIRGYQKFHLAQGWPDVAYHFVIDQAGRVFQGRPPEAVGDTFTGYDPTGHFLVCLDGDFDTETPTARSLESLVQVLAWATQQFSIDPSTLAGHRDYSDLSCPGDSLYAALPEIGQRLTMLARSTIEMRLLDEMG